MYAEKSTTGISLAAMLIRILPDQPRRKTSLDIELPIYSTITECTYSDIFKIVVSAIFKINKTSEDVFEFCLLKKHYVQQYSIRYILQYSTSVFQELSQTFYKIIIINLTVLSLSFDFGCSFHNHRFDTVKGCFPKICNLCGKIFSDRA